MNRSSILAVSIVGTSFTMLSAFDVYIVNDIVPEVCNFTHDNSFSALRKNDIIAAHNVHNVSKEQLSNSRHHHRVATRPDASHKYPQGVLRGSCS